jgi:hypothetical protein
MMQGQVSSAKQPAASLKMTPKHRETEMDRFSTIDDSTGHGSRPRVYLLGENRWEDSSRLIKKSKGQKTNLKPATEKCFSCRGEGITLCTGLFLDTTPKDCRPAESLDEEIVFAILREFQF